jgi:hypothetical protein
LKARHAFSARLLGGLLGLGLATLVVLAFRVPPGNDEARASVVLNVSPTAELAVSKVQSNVRPSVGWAQSASATGGFEVRNQTGTTLTVRVYARDADRDLERHLQVKLQAGRTELARGPVSTLRLGSARRLVLEPGKSRRLRLSTWLRAGDGQMWVGAKKLALGLEARRVGR